MRDYNYGSYKLINHVATVRVLSSGGGGGEASPQLPPKNIINCLML